MLTSFSKVDEDHLDKLKQFQRILILQQTDLRDITFPAAMKEILLQMVILTVSKQKRTLLIKE